MIAFAHVCRDEPQKSYNLLMLCQHLKRPVVKSSQYRAMHCPGIVIYMPRPRAANDMQAHLCELTQHAQHPWHIFTVHHHTVIPGSCLATCCSSCWTRAFRLSVSRSAFAHALLASASLQIRPDREVAFALAFSWPSLNCLFRSSDFFCITQNYCHSSRDILIIQMTGITTVVR